MTITDHYLSKARESAGMSAADTAEAQVFATIALAEEQQVERLPGQQLVDYRDILGWSLERAHLADQMAHARGLVIHQQGRTGIYVHPPTKDAQDD